MISTFSPESTRYNVLVAKDMASVLPGTIMAAQLDNSAKVVRFAASRAGRKSDEVLPLFKALVDTADYPDIMERFKNIDRTIAPTDEEDIPQSRALPERIPLAWFTLQGPGMPPDKFARLLKEDPSLINATLAEELQTTALFHDEDPKGKKGRDRFY